MSLNKNKEKCVELRKIRVKLAKELGLNDIKEEECSYQGECQGTCEKCEYEEKMLLESIYELKKQKKLEIDLIDKKFKDSSILGFLEKRERYPSQDLEIHLEGDIIYDEKEDSEYSKYEEYLSKIDFSKDNKKE